MRKSTIRIGACLPFVVSLILAAAAWGETPAAPMIGQLDSALATVTTITANLRAQIIADQNEIAALTKQLSDAKASKEHDAPKAAP